MNTHVTVTKRILHFLTIALSICAMILIFQCSMRPTNAATPDYSDSATDESVLAFVKAYSPNTYQYLKYEYDRCELSRNITFVILS